MSANIVVKRFESVSAFEDRVMDLIKEEALRHTPAPHAIMLSGGSTPLAIYEALAMDPVVADDSTWITFTDERFVPFDSDQSNFGNAEPMLDELQIPEEQIIKIDPSLHIGDAADQLDKDLDNYLESGGTISLALLGLGADGHTCSLFEITDLQRCLARLAAPIYRPDLPNRVSVGPALLERVDRIVILVKGKEKTAIVERLLKEPLSTTAGMALRNCKNVELWQV
ncbi:MAG: 6-phosphogluconolactonase [Candidatus Hydrogenedentes bacterium]|nr:6-phosphogluconolactonase [Candidatus Hydrogenedentota bacterium]